MLGVELLGNRGLPVHSDVRIEREGRGKQLKMKQKFVIEKENDLEEERIWRRQEGKIKERERRRRVTVSRTLFISVTSTPHLSLSLYFCLIMETQLIMGGEEVGRKWRVWNERDWNEIPRWWESEGKLFLFFYRNGNQISKDSTWTPLNILTNQI